MSQTETTGNTQSDMKTALTRLGTAILLLIGLFSCKAIVLEDRMACPAMLYIDREDGQAIEGDASVLLAVRDSHTSEVIAADNPRLEDLEPDRYSLEIHKSPGIIVSGVIGAKRSRGEGGARTLTIPSGLEGDPLYIFTASSPALDDELIVPAKLRKEHCRMTFRFCLEEGGFPYRLAVIGNASGIDLMSGKPVEGPFRFEPEEEKPGIFHCIVPRQADRLLALELTPKEGLNAHEGFAGTLLLWEYLQRLEGFSWEIENLPDITLDIDFFHLSITVAVNDWNIAQTVSLSI